MKTSAIVTMVLSENRAEGLVRPAYRVDGRGGSRDAAGLQTPLPRGDDLRFRVNRTNIKWPGGLTQRYLRCVASDRANRGLQSVELNDERVRAALVRLDEMSDAELRELVQGEPPTFVEAAEGIIARRWPGDGPS
jgi:hypothetical protein